MRRPSQWPPTREDEIGMLQSPADWPRWPRLPVKRIVDGQQQLGFLEAGEPQVYLGILFAPRPKESIQYDSFEAVYDDGWRVD